MISQSRTSRSLAVMAVLGLWGQSTLAQNAPGPPAMTSSTVGARPSQSCPSLTATQLHAGSVISAQEVAAGDFQPPPAAPGPIPAGPPRAFSVPAFCRVSVRLKPTDDSDIAVEVWLPSANWNGKLEGIGNPGFAGSILYSDLGTGVRGGYVAVSSDGGHVGGSPAFGYQHPERIIDYGWRAAHEMTLAAKALTAAYYGVAPRLSYFAGCSGGGRMALMEAQRFPQDYDGVVAGSAGDNYARLTAYDMWKSLTNTGPDHQPVLGAAQFSLLQAKALEKCDALDGVKDGEIADPRRCVFHASSLRCGAKADPATCLTPAQVAVADKLYRGMRNPKTDALLYPGMIPGGETSYIGATRAPVSMVVDFYRDMALQDPSWDASRLDLSSDIIRAEAAVRSIISDDPDLSAYKARGGKLIQYASWSESTPPPETAINYYESVVKAQHGLAATQDFYRLFVMPNATHCTGGYSAPWFSALQEWVEADRAPNQVIAERLAPAPSTTSTASQSTPDVVARRPICAYPDTRHYRGSGDPSVASSYTCESTFRGPRFGQGPRTMGDPVSSAWAP